MKSTEQYFKDMLTEAGMDQDTINAFVAVANNEKVSPHMQKLINRATSDFDAMKGRAEANEQKLNQYQASVQQWYERDILPRLSQQPQPQPQEQEPDLSLSLNRLREDLMGQIRDQNTRYAKVIKEATRIATVHAARYPGEPLDVEALERLAIENNLPSLEMAYEQFVRPREDEKRQKDLEEKIKAAREEGAREAMSRQKLPVDPVPTERSFLYSNEAPQSKSGSELDAELVATWMGAADKS